MILFLQHNITIHTSGTALAVRVSTETEILQKPNADKSAKQTPQH
jgi:hypothetical protein